jgi:ferredoxin
VIRKLLGKVRAVAKGRRDAPRATRSETKPLAQPDSDPVALPECQVTFVDYDKSIAVHRGKTLLHAVTRAGIPLLHECGGLASCGECRIASVIGEVSDRREIETRILKIMGKPLDGRLACQTLVFGDVAVTVADQE